MTWRLIITLPALAMTISCQPAVPAVTQLEARTCAAQPRLQYAQRLTFDQRSIVDIDTTADCMGADSTKSAYAAFRLPDVPTPYVLRIRSVPLGGTLLSPRVILLDDRDHIIREVPRQNFQFHGAELWLSLRVRDQERYVVVASDPASVGRRESQIMGRVGFEGTNDFTFAHNGRVIVETEPLPTVE